MSHFIQLTSHFNALYALDSEGQVWHLVFGEFPEWRPFVNAKAEPPKGNGKDKDHS